MIKSNPIMLLPGIIVNVNFNHINYISMQQEKVTTVTMHYMHCPNYHEHRHTTHAAHNTQTDNLDLFKT